MAAYARRANVSFLFFLLSSSPGFSGTVWFGLSRSFLSPFCRSLHTLHYTTHSSLARGSFHIARALFSSIRSCCLSVLFGSGSLSFGFSGSAVSVLGSWRIVFVHLHGLTSTSMTKRFGLGQVAVTQAPAWRTLSPAHRVNDEQWRLSRANQAHGSNGVSKDVAWQWKMKEDQAKNKGAAAMFGETNGRAYRGCVSLRRASMLTRSRKTEKYHMRVTQQRIHCGSAVLQLT